MAGRVLDGGELLPAAVSLRATARGDRVLIPGVELVEEIGRGATTVVYRARRDGRQYAVKLLRPTDDAHQVTAVRREAAMLACLNHPGLARIHEVGHAGGRPYLVMDLIEGRSLTRVLREESLDEPRLVGIAAEVASALAAAHRAGLVHRDVKPDNIMIADDGRARVIDFGLATRSGGDVADAAVGTFVYSAPEQTGLLRRPVDGRADLYALRVVLFECVVGTPPFAASDIGELVQMHLSTPAPDVRALRPDVTPALAEVIGKLLAKDPDDRYLSAEGLLGDLQRVAAGEAGPFPLGTAEIVGGSDLELVGREALMRQLLDRWRRAAGGRGGFVLVDGAPGTGKSRLVRELTEVVRSEDRLVLHGKSTADDAVPLAPLRAAVDRYVSDILSLAPPHRAAAVERLRAACGPTAPLLGALCPALTDLLCVSDNDFTYDERQFADAVAALLTGLADGAGGAVLHLDDVQWWDEATRRVVRQLGPLLADSALLVIATARDDAASRPAVEAVVSGVHVDVRIEVQPLDEAAVESLVVRHLGGGRVPADLISRLVARSGGNALAVQEYVRAVIDAGLVRPSWGEWLLDDAGLDALALPADIMELVVRRVDGLSRQARQLLIAAAVSGTRFEMDLIATVCGVNQRLVRSALAEAVAFHLIEATSEGGFAFLHDRIREALLADVDPTARRELHLRIAEALNRVGGGDAKHVYAMARHYLSADTGQCPDRAFRAVWAAGALALAEHAAAEAVDFLSRAATVANAADITLDSGFHATLGIAASRIGQYTVGDEHLGLALAKEQDPISRAHLHHELAKSHNLRWECDQAVERVRRGLAELGHPLPRNRAWYALKSLLLFLAGVLIGRLPKRVRLVEGTARETYALRADLLNTGAHSAAVAMRQPLMVSFTLQALHLVNRLGPGPAYADTQSCLSVLAMVLGWRRHADRVHARAVHAAALTGDPRPIAHTAWMRGILHDVTPALHASTGRDMRQALQVHGRALDTGEYLAGIGAVGAVQILRGYSTDVSRLYRQGLDRSGMSGEALGNVFATIGASAAALAGRPAEAEAQLREVRQFVATLSDNFAQRTNLAVASVHLAVEQGEIGSVLDRAVEEFTELRIKPALLWAVHQPVWIYQAFGRLAQLAAAAAPDRAARLTDARHAVRLLGKLAKGPILRAYHTVAAASLRQLTGDHQGALRSLRDIESHASDLDLPLLGYETARVRARAWRGLGRTAEAHLQAAVALLLATEHGWLTRARWIRSEFDIELPSGPSSRGKDSGGAMTAHRAGTTTTGPGSLHGRRLQALHQVSLAASTVLEPGQVARVALAEVLRIFGAERAFLFLADGERLTPYLGRDASGAEVDRLTGYGSTLVDRVRDTGEALVVTGSEEGAALGSQSSLVYGLRSIMVAPLTLKGRLVGVVYLDSRAAKGIFTTDDVDILAAITTHVAASLETARAAQLEVAVRAAQSERDIAESLRAAMNDLTESLDPTEVSDRLVARVAAALPDSTVLLLRGGPATELTLHGAGGTPHSGGHAVPLDASLKALLDCPTVARGRHPEQDPPLAHLLPAGTTAWLAVPLRVRGVARGLLVTATAAHSYTDTEVEVAAALAGQGAAALDNALLFRKVEDLATRDGLTGLFNRRHFFELAEQREELWRRYRRPVATVMVDIDHFKTINDTYGHAVGDDVIREVGHRLADTLRGTDLICRYGGEEFAILLLETANEDSIAAAHRLHAAVVGSPVPTRAGELPVTVSVGFAEAGIHDDDLLTLLGRADEALYKAKRGGRNAVATHEPL